MPFPFTFIFNGPGITNPFAASNPRHHVRAPSEAVQPAPECNRQQAPLPAEHPKIDRARPRPPSIEPPSRSRKRGWHPAFTEPSQSTTTLASTSGYLYAPARTRDYFMGSAWSRNESDQHDRHEGEEMPPLKKRRGLAGTIISTAVNAALIGGAVGLTVYRLWRNRGKLQQRIEATPEPASEALPPPPPYDAPSHHHVPEPLHIVPLSPPSSAKKSRHARQNKHAAAQHRRRKSHHHRTHSDHLQPIPSSSDPHFPTRPEFDFEPHRDEVEDKMVWIGDKLGMLIEQGKRALNAHVVVSSDAMEDEVDDGSDAWEEENGMGPRHARSRSGSVRHCKRLKTLNLGPGQSTHQVHHTPRVPSSPRLLDFNFPMASSAPTAVSGGLSSVYSTLPASHSTTSLNNISVEDPSTFESRELRESMERARQRLMARRLGGT